MRDNHKVKEDQEGILWQIQEVGEDTENWRKRVGEWGKIRKGW